MKVLFITRPTVFSGPGGDTIQLLKTKQYLEKRGVEVTIADCRNPNLEPYDILHFFNLRSPQDILSNVIKAKKIGKKIALSTIWGSYLECDQKNRHGLQGWLSNNVSEYKLEYLKVVARAVFNQNFNFEMLPYFIRGHLNSQKYIVSNTDVLLPNSPTELERVKKDMTLVNASGISVANAVDLNVFDYESVSEGVYEKHKGCLLCAARVEIRKSQLDLIKAMKGLPYKLVIVGMPSPNSQDYYNACKELADENVTFIEHVSQEELASLYKVCKAHALISWMETPGLSSLEAAVMNSNILITDRGDTEFYFQNYAVYCEPGDVGSIKEGIIKVMENEYDESLKNRIIENFTWDNTADETLAGYNLVLHENAS